MSLILLDWSCRESFHVFNYLKQQNVSRDVFEVIWIEYYHRRPTEIEEYLEEARRTGEAPPLDAWLVLDVPEDVYYHKHLMYNAGLLLARGELACIMDSDAIVGPGFIAALCESFDATPQMALHLDEVRNVDRSHYPFDYPSVEQVRGEGCINWNGATTTGLCDRRTPILTRNYGACLCARRADMLAVGGADEHLDYLGHVCGPYDLTFRMANAGIPEVWHQTEFLYHVWHPGTDGGNNYIGPHDGRNNSLLALEAKRTGRVIPLVENQAVRRLRLAPEATGGVESLLEDVLAPGRLESWRIEENKKLLSLGRQAYYASRFSEAVNILLGQLPALPDDPVIHAEIGWALCVLKRLDQSQAHLDHALAGDPSNPLAHKALGWLLRHRGMPGNALTHFDKALAGAENHLDDFIQESLRGRGWCHLEAGAPEAAEKDFRLALEHTPANAAAVLTELWFGIGLALAKAGDVASARTALETSLGHADSCDATARSDTAAAVRVHLNQLGSHPQVGVQGASFFWKIRQRLRNFFAS